ncbi:MAG: hypothetical protein V4692_05380, partial [Bdellovibrionota bacterium]
MKKVTLSVATVLFFSGLLASQAASAASVKCVASDHVRVIDGLRLSKDQTYLEPASARARLNEDLQIENVMATEAGVAILGSITTRNEGLCG